MAPAGPGRRAAVAGAAAAAAALALGPVAAAVAAGGDAARMRKVVEMKAAAGLARLAGGAVLAGSSLGFLCGTRGETEEQARQFAKTQGTRSRCIVNIGILRLLGHRLDRSHRLGRRDGRRRLN